MNAAKQILEESKVDYYESPIYGLVAKLREQGFQVADTYGDIINKVSEPTPSGLQILKKREGPSRKLLWFTIDEPLPLKLGEIHVDNWYKEADPKNQWLLNVYGRDNIKSLTRLVSEVVKEYNSRVNAQVNLKVVLANEENTAMHSS